MLSILLHVSSNVCFCLVYCMVVYSCFVYFCLVVLVLCSDTSNMAMGVLKFYLLPKQEKARIKVDPSITSKQLEEPLRDFMKTQGHRNVWAMLEPLATLQYNSGTPCSILRDFAPLAKLYVKACKQGMLPSVKHKLALKELNTENCVGTGVLKINFTELEDDIFFDQIDDRVRVLLKHFRVSICNSSGIARQRRLYAVLGPESYSLVASVFSEFSDVF